MKVFVTGAGGGLGQEVPEVFVDDEVVGRTHADLDITDREAVLRDIEDEKPDLVIHAAAYTNVDQAETYREVAHKANVDGARNVAEAAANNGAALIFPSTDYVFDGRKGSPYIEADVARPLNYYGETKLAGEAAVLEVHPQALVARVSWLYSQRGKSLATTMLRYFVEREKLSMVSDQFGSPTYSRDYLRGAAVLLKAGAAGLYHVAAEGETSRYGFVHKLAELVGSKVVLEKTTAAEYDLPAKRPARCSLDSSRARALGAGLPQWEDSLYAYLVDRGLVAADESQVAKQ
jgi:dTDP-4-dehydrorhamnose reductase